MQRASNQVWARGADEDVDSFADELAAIYNDSYNCLKLYFRDDSMMAYYDTASVPEPHVIRELSGRFPGLTIKMVGFEMLCACRKGGWVYQAGECIYESNRPMSPDRCVPRITWEGVIDLSEDDMELMEEDMDLSQDDMELTEDDMDLVVLMPYD